MNYLRSAKMKFGSRFDSTFTSTIVYTPSEKPYENIQQSTAVITMTRRAIEPLPLKQPLVREQYTPLETQDDVPMTEIEDDAPIPDVLEIVLKPQSQEDLYKPAMQKDAHQPEILRESTIPEFLQEPPKPEILKEPSQPEILEATSTPEIREDGPKQKNDLEFHGDMVLSQWDKLLALLSGGVDEFAIDGDSLDLATIIAVAK